MSATHARSLNVVLSVLLILTLISWRVAAPGYAQAQVDAWVTIGVLITGFVKCRLIMSHFMEVRRSRRSLRLFADIWLLTFFGAIAAIYAWR
jgi:hypothetical protein